MVILWSGKGRDRPIGALITGSSAITGAGRSLCARAAAHLFQLHAGGHLLGEQGGLTSVLISRSASPACATSALSRSRARLCTHWSVAPGTVDTAFQQHLRDTPEADFPSRQKFTV
jgi:hypothetical protein